MGVRPTVVITDSNLDSADDERILREAGIATVRLQARTENEVISGLSVVPAAAIIVQWAPVTAAVLDAAPGCQFVSRLGIGYDMIDVAAATRRGVAVGQNPPHHLGAGGAATLAPVPWVWPRPRAGLGAGPAPAL